MPQDSSKSGVYRSFFSCDDPKGAAECKTIRKSKIETQKPEYRLENQNKQKNMSFSYNPPRKETFSHLPTDELDDHSSIKLGEITRGAQKLDQVIDTWSSGNISGRQSKDIAKNLLRGALELHESLEMLGKLQEASQYMAKWKRKQKEKVGGGKLDVAGIHRTSSDEFGSGSHRIEFQRPRLSADGSSKDCYEELREAIREGLAKQNLLPKSSGEDRAYIDRTKDSAEQKPYIHGAKVPNGENAYFRRSKSFGETKSYFDKTKLELSLDFPSTSTSQSSMCYSHEFDTTDTSFSKSFEEKPKGPNVVAKLMGLDDNLPKTSPLTLEMQLRKDKELNHRRPFLDMDFPKARRSHFSSVQKVDSGERTFDELIQTVQYKGIVTSMSIDRSGSQKDISKVYDKRKWLADDAPPIVIIKPRHFTGLMEENLYKNKYFCNDSDPKEIIRKLGMKKVVPKIGTNAKRGALNISEIQRSLQAEMTTLQHEEDKEYGDARTRRDDRAVKEELLPTKTKVSVSAKPKLQKKEVMLQEVGKSITLAPNTGVATDVDTTKIREGPKHRNTSKTESTCDRKSDRASNFSKDHISKQKATTSNTTEVNAPKAPQRNRIKKAKPEKSVSIPPPTVLVEKQLENVSIRINQSPESDHDLSVTKTVISEKLVCEYANDLSQCLDECNVNGSDLFEYTLPIIEQKCDTKSSEDTVCRITNNPTEKQSCDEETSKISRNLLLGSALFFNKLQELFYASAHQPVLSHTNSFAYHKIPDPKHLVDCGKELLEYKNQQCTQAVHSWSQIVANKPNIFTDPLVYEICEGIEDLRNYQNLTSDKVTGDSIHKVLDKDLWCRGVVSGGWDMGWRSGFTQYEVEKIVLHIEQGIFSGIIDKAVEDMLS